MYRVQILEALVDYKLTKAPMQYIPYNMHSVSPCFALLCRDELVESCDSLIHILQGYVSGSIVLVQVFCQDMSKTVLYLTTTPHNKAGIVCIILGLYYKSSIVLAVLARWQHMLEHQEDYVTLEP